MTLQPGWLKRQLDSVHEEVSKWPKWMRVAGELEIDIKTYQDWCKVNNSSHAHCPNDCEHPQPFVVDGELYCGRCAVYENELIEMVACDIKTCGE